MLPTVVMMLATTETIMTHDLTHLLKSNHELQNENTQSVQFWDMFRCVQVC